MLEALSFRLEALHHVFGARWKEAHQVSCVGRAVCCNLHPVWLKKHFEWAECSRSCDPYENELFVAQMLVGTVPLFGQPQGPNLSRAAWQMQSLRKDLRVCSYHF